MVTVSSLIVILIYLLIVYFFYLYLYDQLAILALLQKIAHPPAPLPHTSSPTTQNMLHYMRADLPEDKPQYTKHCICIKLTARSLAKSCHLTKLQGMGKGMTFAYWSSKFTWQMGMNTQVGGIHGHCTV